MAEQEQEQQELEEVNQDDILQQFETADGGTIVLSSEQLAQMQQGMAEQHFVEEIIGGDPSAEHEEGHIEGMETQQIHLDAEGNAHIVTQGQIGDLVTFHAVDAQGNYVGEGAGDVGVTVEGDMGGHVEIPMNHHEGIMEADNVVEQVIDGQESYVEDEEESMNVDQEEYVEQVFNPETGTFSQVTKPGQKIHNQQVKYVLSQSTADGQNQQIVLDANSLQGLIQGGALTVDSSGGKQIILTQPHQSQSPSKPKQVVTTTRSPTKILPAPHPLGDQQQSGSGGVKKIVYLQGGGSIVSQLPASQGETKLIATGSGNQLQLVRVVQKSSQNKVAIAPANLKPRPVPVAPKPGPGGTILIPTSSSMESSVQSGNVVVLPNYLKDQSSRSSESSGNILSELGGIGGSNMDSFRSLLEPNGMRPRKPCNCTKSQCLKLYCDCFANGEFCHLCNCNNCYNNLQHEEDRQKAIKLVLERNPGAFRPKIGKSSMCGEAHERRHNKGCNCRRSGCLKNYCECYEAKIFCSGICKCTGCKNCIENIPSGLPNGVGVEQHFAGAGTAHKQTLKDLAEAAEVRVQQQNQVRSKMRAQMQEVSPQNNLGIMVPPIVFRYPHGSISYEVITSTVELLLAKAEAAEKMRLSEGEAERLILDEFGDCLSSVMDLGTSIDRHWP